MHVSPKTSARTHEKRDLMFELLSCFLEAKLLWMGNRKETIRDILSSLSNDNRSESEMATQ